MTVSVDIDFGRDALSAEALVAQTMPSLLARAQRVGEVFLLELYTLAPECRTMFKGPTAGHGQVMLDALQAFLDAGHDDVRFDHLCARLAEQHRVVGVSEEHYDAAGAALLRTLRELLGPEFDEETENAWASLYGRLAESMLASGTTDDSLHKLATSRSLKNSLITHA